MELLSGWWKFLSRVWRTVGGSGMAWSAPTGLNRAEGLLGENLRRPAEREGAPAGGMMSVAGSEVATPSGPVSLRAGAGASRMK